jgi:hypothetical protein
MFDRHDKHGRRIPREVLLLSVMALGLGSCAGMSGEVSARVKVEKPREGPVTGTLEAGGSATFGGGGSQSGGGVVYPDISMIGLCFRRDIASGGAVTPGTPIQITGSGPINVPAPPDGGFPIDHWFNWGSTILVTGRPSLTPNPSHYGAPDRVLITSLLPDGSSGSENTTIDMTIRAPDLTIGSGRALAVHSSVEDLLQGGAPLLPVWAEEVTFSSWRRVTSGAGVGDIHLTVGALGRVAHSFRLDVNDTVGYVDLATAQVSIRGPWVIFETDIDEADINAPQELEEWASNTLHIEYETDRTGLTVEDHMLDYRFLP